MKKRCKQPRLNAASPQIRSEVRVNRKFLTRSYSPGTLRLSLSLSATLRMALNLLPLAQHSLHDVLSLMISRSLLYIQPPPLSASCSQSPTPVLSSTFISLVCRSCMRSLPLSLSSSSPPLPARFVHTVTDRRTDRLLAQLRKTDDRPTAVTADRQTGRQVDR